METLEYIREYVKLLHRYLPNDKFVVLKCSKCGVDTPKKARVAKPVCPDCRYKHFKAYAIKYKARKKI